MQTNQLYDADSIAARWNVQNWLIIAAREQIIQEAQHANRHRAYIALVGRQLVRLGHRPQAMAQQPIYQEETV